MKANGFEVIGMIVDPWDHGIDTHPWYCLKFAFDGASSLFSLHAGRACGILATIFFADIRRSTFLFVKVAIVIPNGYTHAHASIQVYHSFD